MHGACNEHLTRTSTCNEHLTRTSTHSPSYPHTTHSTQILAKAEFLNPGGSVKDRVALEMVQEALATGALTPGGLVTEGTAGSTGISLALVCAAYHCKCFIAMPDDAAVEKLHALQALGVCFRGCFVSLCNP